MAEKLYVALLVGSYLLVALGIAFRLLPLWSLLVFVTLPEARQLTRMFRGAVPDNADPRTAALAFKFSLLYLASLLLFLAIPLKLPA